MEDSGADVFDVEILENLMTHFTKEVQKHQIFEKSVAAHEAAKRSA